MNYINHLEKVIRTQLTVTCETEQAINDLLSYLQSPKFHRDTTVQVQDVLNLLVPIRNSVSGIAQDLAHKRAASE